ncbi:hypothetical protein LPTSP4_08490 [Leptospira ryugenii]|uniref:AMP-dependent synthetase/ligase domain-containing protein n=1 Tax=Leptospira ryugenii TaxID=1917863 RepID=A0A2P2DXH5_9LEPT|nr:hypothetical protein [Leptospira ryugenii]GBF49338.1 hypothetical protein LPTSP4_08490 [Leptospira ryugenii]
MEPKQSHFDSHLWSLYQNIEEDEKDPWKQILFSLLVKQAEPILIESEHIISASALWSYLSVWKEVFRNAGLKEGGKIYISLPPSPLWVIAIITCLWEKISVDLVPEAMVGGFGFPNDSVLLSEGDQSHFTIHRDYTLSQRKPCQPKEDPVRKQSIGFIHGDKAKKTEIIEAPALLSLLKKIPASYQRNIRIQTLDWNTPTGFVLDFVSSFFSRSELFFPNKSQTVQNVLKLTENYDGLRRVWFAKKEAEQMEKDVLTAPKTLIHCLPEDWGEMDLALLLDGDFTFPEKGNLVRNDYGIRKLLF